MGNVEAYRKTTPPFRVDIQLKNTKAHSLVESRNVAGSYNKGM